MRILWLGVAFFFAHTLAFGQLESDTVTISASRTVNLPPDQVVFGVQVDSGLDIGLEPVVTALQVSGITAAKFSGVRVEGSTLNWSFTFPVAFSKMKDAMASLTTLQQTIMKAGLLLTLYVQGIQTSPELRSQPCSLPDLVADARARAQKLAGATGLFVGPVVALSNASPAVTAGRIAPPAPALIRGVDAIGLTVSGLLLGIPGRAPSPTVCSLVVKFKLLRYQ